MNSTSPQDIWRSEAFAEDLFEESAFDPAQAPRITLLNSTLLCAVPAVVALLGGVAAFFQTVG